MSPEVINNNFKCGIYSDLWSIGCVIFTMVYGFAPFVDKTEYLIFQNILNLNYRFPTIKIVCPNIKNLIKSLLKLNPFERILNNLNLEELKKFCFFNNFNPNTIDADLKNAFFIIGGRRYSIDGKNLNIIDIKISPIKEFHTNYKINKALFSNEKNLRLSNFNDNKNSNFNKKIEDFKIQKNDNLNNLKKFDLLFIENEKTLISIQKNVENKGKYTFIRSN